MNKGHLPSDQIITISLASLPKVVALSEKVNDDGDDNDDDDDDDDEDAKEKPAKHQKKSQRRQGGGTLCKGCRGRASAHD